MDRDRTSSDSSSWSLVDIEDDASDSDVDVIGNNLVVESVHDSDSEVEEAEEGSVVYDESEDDESDVESIQETENEEYGNSDESLSENEEETVEVVQEIEEIVEPLQHVEQTKVVQTLDQLSKCAESPFEKFVNTVAKEANARSLTFVVIVAATIFGAGLGHYIGACLIGNRPSDSLTFCLESERTQFAHLFENPGLQYQDSPKTGPFEDSWMADPLLQCEEKLFDAKAEVRMKQGVNRFVRESYKKQLARAKQEFETRLALYKRASRQLLASRYVPVSNPKTEMVNKTDLIGPICSLAERKIVNLTKSIFISVSNWTQQPVVQNLIKITPKIDKSLEKLYTWSAKSFNKMFDKVNALAKMPKFNLPRKVKEFVRSDLKNYAKKAFSSATTALSQTNLSSMVAKCKPLLKNLGKHVEPTLTRLSKFSLSKFSKEVCFSTSPCESAAKLAKVINKNGEIVHRLGQSRVNEYTSFLNSLTNKNCSKQLECEKLWWFGCQNEILESCQLKDWQKAGEISGIGLMNRKRDLKQVAVEIGWIQSKNTLINCPVQPIPLPSLQMPMPPPSQPTLRPCHVGPNPAKPCQSEATLPHPCKSTADVKPADWFSRRAQVRAEQRSIHKKQTRKSRSSQQQRIRP